MEVLDWFALIGLFAGVWAGARGVRLLGRGLRHADDARAALWVIRGIRGVVVAVSAAILAAGILFRQAGLLVLGGTFLAEELYETGVVALILRWGQRQGAREATGRRRTRRGGGATDRLTAARWPPSIAMKWCAEPNVRPRRRSGWGPGARDAQR